MSTTDIGRLLTAETDFPALFAKPTSTPWGRLYLYPQNTMATEGNRGVLVRPQSDYVNLLQETETFYNAAGQPARLLAILPRQEQEKWERAVATAGGRFTLQTPAFFAAYRPAEAFHTPLTFDREPFGPDLRETVFCDRPHLEGVLTRAEAHEEFCLVVGQLFGTPVTAASVWCRGDHTVVSHVVTAPGFEGYGFATALMKHLMTRYAAEEAPLVLTAAEEAACRLYRRVGLQELPEDRFLAEWEKA